MELKKYLIYIGWGCAVKEMKDYHFNNILLKIKRISGIEYNIEDDIPEKHLDQLFCEIKHDVNNGIKKQDLKGA